MPSELGKTSPLVPEAFDLILALCRRPDKGPVPAQAVARLEDREFREVFHGLATKHGVLGLALTTLGQLSATTTLSPETRQRVLAPLRILKQQALLWDLERDRVLRVLARENLPVVVLKGGALREYAFANAVDRQLGDLDLLLDQDLVDRAATILSTSGYQLPASEAVLRGFREHHFHLPLTHPGGFEVELHWALDSPHHVFTLDPAGVMARATVISRAEGDLTMPSPEDMLLHLASQNTEDGFSRLRRLVDADRIIDRGEVDWSQLVREARKSRLEVILALTLRLSDCLLGTGVPDGYIERLGVSRLARIHLALLDPPSWLPSATGPRYHLGHLAVSFWSTSPDRRMRRLRQVSTGDRDPLTWLWEGKAQPGETPHRLTPGPVLMIRLFGYHLLIWARGVARLATHAGRRQLSFWTS